MHELFRNSSASVLWVSIDDFLQTPPDQILAELKAVRAEKVVLDRKEKLLEQLATFRLEQGDGQALAGVVGTLRAQIMAIMATKPASKLWLPREVRRQLIERGTDATIDHIRMTMGRMAASGELEKPNSRQLAFRLPGQAA
jgi:hypothetical protein